MTVVTYFLCLVGDGVAGGRGGGHLHSKNQTLQVYRVHTIPFPYEPLELSQRS